jgi:hypothetical protein
MVCSNCFFNKTEDALIDILQKKAPVTRLSLQDEYQVHSGKPAVQSGAINPDYMLWLEATVQNLRNITKSTSY